MFFEFNKSKFAKRIKEIRLGKGLIQDEVCDRIGIDSPNYSNIETAKTTPTLQSLCKIISGLEITPNEVFEYEHLENEKTLDEMNLKIYNNFSLKKKQSIYKIMRALEDLN